MSETNGNNEDGGVEIECPTPEVDATIDLRPLSQIALEAVRNTLKDYEEKKTMKMFQGACLTDLTKEELIKVIDKVWDKITKGDN